MMGRLISKFLADGGGATAIEYGLIAGIIGVGLVASFTAMKDSLVTLFGSVMSGF
jgi:pilus assembly protein Flp/PilA